MNQDPNPPVVSLSHRIVHLDLKGAPLKIPYLDRVIPLFKKWGATGILLEWEDTFPYTGNLEEVGSLSNAGGDNLYSMEEVEHIMQCIKHHGLEPVQLVQTMGHMEFVLKHKKFHTLQEVPQSPAVLCPSQAASLELIHDMINQTLDIQPDAKFFHIGADEVWHTGICALCKVRAEQHIFKEASLYMDHIKHLVLYIKQKRPDITILMWDDMLRNMNQVILQEYNLGDHVIPVLWNYNPEETFTVTQEVEVSYAFLFPRVWIGTAFKGANGSCQGADVYATAPPAATVQRYNTATGRRHGVALRWHTAYRPALSPTLRYISNHRAWVQQMRQQKERGYYYYTGAIITGWSRYDHYATLCELLPTSLPSLAGCLDVLMAAEALHYDPEDSPAIELLPSDQWPGEEIAKCVHAFFLSKQRIVALLSSDLINTWLNPWQLSRQYTVPGHTAGIMVTAEHLQTEMQVIRANMLIFLQEITGERSKEEWIMSNIDPLLAKLGRLIERAQSRSVCPASIKPVAPVTESQEK